MELKTKRVFELELGEEFLKFGSEFYVSKIEKGRLYYRNDTTVYDISAFSKEMVQLTGFKVKVRPWSRLNSNLQAPKKIFCVETGEGFDSVSEAAERFGLSRPQVSRCLNGKLHDVCGYTFKMTE